jgi:cyclophilin family peptidyl-prolyl cis-trans isomerase
MLKSISFSLLVCFLMQTNLINAQKNESNTPKLEDGMYAEMTTSKGVIILQLEFEKTPLTVANFVGLAEGAIENTAKKAGVPFYDSLKFHRVIKDFMVQSGDPKSINASPTAMIGDGGPNYTVPSEIKPNLYHFKGALSAARQSEDVNPMKNSSGSQFFIVTGTLLDELHLKQSLEAQAFENFKKEPANQETFLKGQALSQAGNMAALQELEQDVQKRLQPIIDKMYASLPVQVKQRYANWGGAPSLDNNYTVFGKLVSGYNVLSSIENEPTGSADRPKKDVKIIEAFIQE